MDLVDLLRSANTIAIVGCSPRPAHTSHYIARYLIDSGYEVIPVNPYHDEILDRQCYPDLVSIPADISLDIINVYRRSAFTADSVRDAIARMEQTGQNPAFWTQYGVHSVEAQQLAEAHDLPYIASRCIMVEHGRVPV